MEVCCDVADPSSAQRGRRFDCQGQQINAGFEGGARRAWAPVAMPGIPNVRFLRDWKALDIRCGPRGSQSLRAEPVPLGHVQPERNLHAAQRAHVLAALRLGHVAEAIEPHWRAASGRQVGQGLVAARVVWPDRGFGLLAERRLQRALVRGLAQRQLAVVGTDDQRTLACLPAASAASGRSARKRPSMIDIARPAGVWSRASWANVCSQLAPSPSMPSERAESRVIFSAAARSLDARSGPGAPGGTAC